MQVIDILRHKGRDVVFLPADANVSDATVLLAAKRIGAVVIKDEHGHVAGILSERDVVKAVATESVRALARPVSAFMTHAVATCSETDSVEALMAMMTEGRFRHVPVLDSGGELVGLVSIGDVVKAHIEETTREASNLREFIVAAR
ncbi:CBS domain-containing protein [Rhizomicrobium electricum]|jgi:CBS domain-containing protein|uniref:CBS domain-containing protein n=1 Tax=Rhizomicrobium electricum TaxID=480070 RepID=A0ABP3PY39_9PROT|nr:CBS domain-containing protein [Rhizomicrobium electricum]NIJ49775.1 CBS domain-containing protein [Rhizomicrobium electricum]